MANTLNAYRNGAVGFIDWLDRGLFIGVEVSILDQYEVVWISTLSSDLLVTEDPPVIAFMNQNGFPSHPFRCAKSHPAQSPVAKSNKNKWKINGGKIG